MFRNDIFDNKIFLVIKILKRGFSKNRFIPNKKMRIIGIILAAILAIIGILQPQIVPQWLTILAIIIILLIAIIEAIEYKKQSKQEAKEQHVGVLKTKSKIILSPAPKTFAKLEIGDTGSTFELGGGDNTRFFSSLLKDNNFVLVTEDGQIKLTMRIRDRSGKIVVEIDKNEWKDNPNNSFDRNYSKNALEVKDSSGDIILQVRIVNDRVQLQGKFYRCDGSGIEIGILSPEDEKYPGAIRFLDPDTSSKLEIEPLFKYPSELHLGKLMKSE